MIGEALAQHRPRLLRLAQRMLGSAQEAEDVLQDAFLRLYEVDASSVRTPEAFLVSTVTRLALDRLRRAKTERTYVGQWLPEPFLLTAQASAAPDARGERASDLSYAALVLLSQLSSEERAAFLLREVFELDYAQVAEALGRTEPATRKLVQRAHTHLADKRPRHEASADERRVLLQRFKAACEASDAGALAALLAPEATYTTDGGGKVFAARDVLVGAPRIAHLTITSARKQPAFELQVIELDGEPALATVQSGVLTALVMIAGDAGRIRDIYKILNPDKLEAARALVAHWRVDYRQ